MGEQLTWPRGQPAAAFGPIAELESPFTAEYALEGEVVASPEADQYARLIGELRDPEFEEAVTDLVNEASALTVRRSR